MARRAGGLALLATSLFLSACGGDDGASNAAISCGGDTPVECRSPEGKLLGCCPPTHPVCSLDGLSCGDFGGGGGGTGGSASGGGGGGGAAGQAGGNGGASASGGTGAVAGGGASGGTAGTGGSATGGTGGTGAACNDPDEPHDTEDNPLYLGAISDCDSGAASTDGVLSGKSDVDWFTFYGNDTSGCVVDPFASTTANVRLCVFADCPSAQVSCSAGSIAASPGGRPGCCVVGGGQLPVSLNCNGIDDSAMIYLRIDQPAPNQSCEPYSVDYHF